MLWLILFLIIFVLFVVLVKTNSSKHPSSPENESSDSHERYIFRDGNLKEADGVFDAWTSGDLRAMLSQLNVKTNLIDRHFLLMNTVKHTYKHRDDPEMRAICHRVARMHIKEFPRIMPALKKDLGSLPRVSTFQQYATVLTEEEKFTEAIAVCEAAIKFGLRDGTQGDFDGRIERIKKKEVKARKAGK